MLPVYIVHLSDLHISSKSLTKTLEKLIADIKIQTQVIEKLILIISGDIIDKGNYSEGLPGVMAFFKKLKVVLSNKVLDVLIVPGNHDKTQHDDIKLYGKIEKKDSIQLDEKIWMLQNDHYKAYLSMVSDIRNIFGLSDTFDNTFFVKRIDLDNLCVTIVGLDTTWVSYGEEKEEDLLVGNYQLNKLYDAYKSLKEANCVVKERAQLTIGVGHHPTSWIHPSDRKTLRKYMIDDEYFGMNLYLCGHIHDMEIENWNNNSSSIMTLVTGIGWNHLQGTASGQDKKDEHRYSIYAIDVTKNVISIIVRKTNKSGQFTSDYSLYGDDGDNKLTFPLALRTGKQPILNLNVMEPNYIRGLYFDKDFMALVSELHRCMLEFEKKVTSLSYHYAHDIAEILVANGIDKEEEVIKYILGEISEMNDGIRTVLASNSEIVCDYFQGYLQEITNYFAHIFGEQFKDDQVIRMHFRIYDINKDSYNRLCQCSSNGNYRDSVKTIQWGGLIEESFLEKKSLIYSVNKNNIIDTDWDDFMTIVPAFWNNETDNVIGKKHEKRPIITAGFSVRGFEPKESGSNILYALEYLGAYSTICDILDGFVMKYQLDARTFMEEISK